MKLDPKNIRYLTTEDWRVLTAIEQGSRNHEIVPTPLITSLSNLRAGSQIQKSISVLAKGNLISRVRNARYDGYRLGYGGLDYLALHAHLKSGTLYSIGNQIGVGKESDIYVVASPNGRRLVLKIHRLGRLSFRTVKQNRDYLRNRHSGSWMYMSRLAALKEYTFMRALRDAGFPVPEPVACNRHTVVMELIDAFPLRQISKVPDPAVLYAQLIDQILRLAKVGLIHGDFNEFNILVEEKEIQQQTEEESRPPDTTSSTPLSEIPEASQEISAAVSLNPIIIDFPQTLSISHANAEYYFNRDVQCIKTFFQRRFQFTSDEPGPFFADAVKDVGAGNGARRLDVEVEASGFNKKMAKELEKYMVEVGVDGDANGEGGEEEEQEGVEDENYVEDEARESVEVGSNDVPTEALPVDVAANTNAPPSEQSLVDGMTVLQLADDIAGSTATAPSQQKMFDTISHAGTVSNSKTRSAAKAARGWAI